jgi:hypothetical protein
MSASGTVVGFLYDFWVPRDLVFVNGLWASSSLCALKISASAVELGFLGDVFVRMVPVFFNGFWVSSSLCPLKILASAVKLGSRDDFWVGNDAFFINGFCVCSSLCALKISASGIELGLGLEGRNFHQLFLSQQLSMFVEDFSVSRRTRLLGWCFCPHGPSFFQRF